MASSEIPDADRALLNQLAFLEWAMHQYHARGPRYLLPVRLCSWLNHPMWAHTGRRRLMFRSVVESGVPLRRNLRG